MDLDFNDGVNGTELPVENDIPEWHESTPNIGDPVSEEHMVTPNAQRHIQIEVGMEFANVEDVELLYAQYAREMGFGICRRNSREKNVQFFCHKEGLPRKRKTQSNEIPIVEEPQRVTKSAKVGCRACLYIALNRNGQTWRITKFIETHNHEMISPNSLKFLRGQKKFSSSAKCLSLVFENQGIPVGKVPDVLCSIPEESGFTRKDCYNYLSSVRSRILDAGDAQAVALFCSRQQEMNPNFRYAIQTYLEDRLTNFFWIDARSRAAYEIFGDVVSFDTTYRTNKYNMPFAPFIGVDNHMQTILFGCALLQDETEDTFVWLFESWLHAMNGKQPNGFITDQDMAIMNAAGRVFPTSRHRLCLWHINKKFPERLSHIYHETSKFKQLLNTCIYGSMSIEQFEEDWERLVHEFNLHGNDWFTHLYSLRHMWVPLFSKDYFFAGMNTTGRSESINAFFDAFVHSGTTLKEFVGKYAQTIDRRYETFRRAEFHSRHKYLVLSLGMGLEEHAGSIFTSEIFRIFQGELRKILSYSRELVSELDSLKIYQVSNRLDRRDVVIVEFHVDTLDSLCECRMFQSQGILCGHICCTLFENRVEKIPQQYILQRWTKDIGRILWDHPVARAAICTPVIHSFDYKECFDELVHMGDSSDVMHAYILKGLLSLKLSAKEKFNSLSSQELVGSSNTPQPLPISGQESAAHVGDPNIARTKGRRKSAHSQSSRIRSGIEIANDNRVRCFVCHAIGHNRRTCPTVKGHES